MSEELVELRKALDRRRASMDVEWNDWEPHFRDLRRWIMPRRGRFEQSTRDDRASKRNTEIIDATAREGLRTLETGMHAGITSPSRKWFKLGLLDPSATEAPANKLWLSIAERRMYEVMRATNIYRMFPLAYRDLGLYGHHYSLLLPNFENVVHAHSYAVGEYRFSDNEFDHVDTAYRWMRMSAEKIVDRWGKDAVTNAVYNDYKSDKPQATHLVKCAIEPRKQRDPSSPLAIDMPIGVYYWLDDAPSDQFLEIGGHTIKRIVGPRWDVEPGNVYSHAPAMDALGDAATLQQQHVDKAVAIQKSYNPPLQGHVANKRNRAKNFPGGISFMDTSDLQKGGLRPLYEVKPDISGLLADMEETRQRIRSAFFVDLFQMFTALDRRQITAEEILKRYEEKVLMLGPTLERVDNEMLDVVIEIVFHDMLQAGLFPPAPAELEGQEIRVEYVSMLHQAQKAAGIQAMERTIGFIGTLGSIKPAAVDKLDEDAMVDEFAQQVGIVPSVIRDDKNVAEIRRERAQAEQEREGLELLTKGGGAQLLADAAARGNSDGAPGGVPL